MIQRAFSIPFHAINILTELALTVGPTFVVAGLHASRNRRTVFIAAFRCRMLYVPFDHWREDYLADLVQRYHCLRRSDGLNHPGSRGQRLNFRLMAWNNLYGDRTVCQSHNSVHTIPTAEALELEVWIFLRRRLQTSEYQNSSYASGRPSKSASTS